MTWRHKSRPWRACEDRLEVMKFFIFYSIWLQSGDRQVFQVHQDALALFFWLMFSLALSGLLKLDNLALSFIHQAGAWMSSRALGSEEARGNHDISVLCFSFWPIDSLYHLDALILSIHHFQFLCDKIGRSLQILSLIYLNNTCFVFVQLRSFPKWVAQVKP